MPSNLSGDEGRHRKQHKHRSTEYRESHGRRGFVKHEFLKKIATRRVLCSEPVEAN